ncbi:hypothetical protein OG763_14230 [Streptomyces sp. NBC_01230]|uniref:hypothetical protein n=1 Tax=Streptomyces sp. NBC_01230 TaxID=2903784 RepID=UPI002E159102|nr:hypothetical protein OG763_14230 [Streptomyces sp. NBC_01230]
MADASVLDEQPAGEPRTYWVLYEDGALARIEAIGDEVKVPEGGQLLTEEEYEQRLQQWQEANDAHVAELKAADQARQTEDYEALLAAGLPEATAARLAGYEPPQVDEPSEEDH